MCVLINARKNGGKAKGEKKKKGKKKEKQENGKKGVR